MTMIAPLIQILDIIATETNLKCLDVFREQDKYEFATAKIIDDHLNDLGKRIAEALEGVGEMPAPDEFEVWLAEKRTSPVDKHTAEQLVDAAVVGVEVVETKRVKKRVTTTESNENPVTERSTPSTVPEKPRVDSASGSPVSGGDSNVTNLSNLTTRLRTFKNDHHFSNNKLGKLIGISDVTIAALIKGKTKANPKTSAKVLKAINNYGKPEKKPSENSAKVTNGEDRSAAAYIQTKLKAWFEQEDLGPSSAAPVLEITEHCLRSILNGHMPHSNVVYQLSKYIPAISAQEPMLTAAAEQQEAA